MQKDLDSAHHDCGCGCGGGAGPKVGNLPDWASLAEDTLVCHCGRVSKGEIKRAVEMGAFTLPLIKVMTGACRGKKCESLNPLGRCCEADIHELIRLYHPGPPEPHGQGGCSC